MTHSWNPRLAAGALGDLSVDVGNLHAQRLALRLRPSGNLLRAARPRVNKRLLAKAKLHRARAFTSVVRRG